jgi:predicted secreted protein
VAGFALSAMAGDAAARSILGFSPDGKLFAFEQFGVFYEDEGGYAELQVIDTTTDSFVKGAPSRSATRKDVDDLDALTAGQRVKARAPFIDFLRSKRINQQGARFEGAPSMALDDPGIYQLAGEPLAAAMALPLSERSIGRLDIEPVPLGTAKCDGAGGRGVAGEAPVAGYTLRLMLGGETLVLHSDQKLPAARRCAGAYGLAEAYVHKARDGERTLAVIVGFTDFHDFHAGPNRRLMAVTKRLGKA